MSLGTELAAVSSGDITGDVAVMAGAGLLWGLQLSVGSTNSKLILYDEASATGTVLAQITLDAGTEAADGTTTITFTQPVNVVNGIYADWGGTGAIGRVWYNKR